MTLIARDAFGAPVPGAAIVLLKSSPPNIVELSALTDANGRAEVVGGFENAYAARVSATDMLGISYEPHHPAADRVDFEVTLHPESADAGGVSRLSVTSTAADGRQLEFSARLYVVEGYAFETVGSLEDWNLAAVNVLPCEPDVGNDTTTFTADCVEGPAGFDAPYEGSTLTQGWVDPQPVPAPLAISLLVDQGASVAVTDPADRRLLAARYFQTRLKADDQVALAAFAANDAITGDVALLADQPVTIFPIGNPGFTTDGRAHFPVIESLATLEGGASPLHAAIGEMIGFTASAAPASSRRAVAVLASGVSDCNTLADCDAAQDALRALSASSGVAVVVVGLTGQSPLADRKRLGTFAQSEQGAVIWAQDPTLIPTVLGRLPEILDGRHGALDVTIRLESSRLGAFSSGRTVVGTLRVVVCPWECTETVDVPFAVRVP